MSRPQTVGVLAELADLLAAHGRLRMSLNVEKDDDSGLLLTVLVPIQSEGTVNAAQALNLYHALQYLRDIVLMRAFATIYHNDPAALEAILPKEEK